MKVGSLIETTNEYALAEMAIDAYIDGDRSLLEAYGSGDISYLLEVVNSKTKEQRRAALDKELKRRGLVDIGSEPWMYSNTQRSLENRGIDTTDLTNPIVQHAMQKSNIKRQLSMLAPKDKKKLIGGYDVIYDNNKKGRGVSAATVNFSPYLYTDDPERIENIERLTKSNGKRETEIRNQFAINSLEYHSDLRAEILDTIRKLPKNKQKAFKEKLNIANFDGQKLRELRNELKRRPIYDPDNTEPTQVNPQEEKRTKEEVSKIEEKSKRAPKNVLIRMVTALRNLYKKWLNKQNRAKARGENIGPIKSLLTFILNAIDKLMKRIRIAAS